MNESDGKEKGRPIKIIIRSFLGRHGLFLGVVMLLVIPLCLLHLGGEGVGVLDVNGGSVVSKNEPVDSGADAANLHDCQVHLQEVERAAKSSLASVKRSNVVVEELSKKLSDCGGGGEGGVGGGVQIEVPPCPACDACPSCPTCPVCPSVASSGFLASGHAKKWLTVGIPTVPREDNHLGTTLESWIRQLPVHDKDPLYDDVILVVMNMHGAGHDWFYKAKEKYSGSHPFSRYFRFTEETHKSPDPVPHLTATKDAGDANHPGFRVRKQTRNIVSLMTESEVS